MEHNVRKLNRYIACIEGCAPEMPYAEMLNHWMEDTGEVLTDEGELRYYLRLIPMIIRRKKKRGTKLA